MTIKALVPQQSGDLTTTDIMEDFGKFLRLHTAGGDVGAGRGREVRPLANMLGHANVSTTRIYAHIVDKMTGNPVQFLEAMLRA